MTISRETVAFAAEMIPTLRKGGATWKELRSPVTLCESIQFFLDFAQEDNLLDVEDVIIEIAFYMGRYGARRSLKEMIMYFIDRRSSRKTDDSPTFTQIVGMSNDDDLQSCGNDDSLKVTNDLSGICCPDVGPGSDFHIALMDLEEQLGEDTADIFECRFAGESRKSIEDDRGYSAKKIRYAEDRACEFLRDGEYTLDPQNRRLGCSKKFEDGQTFFKADRKNTGGKCELPDVDHRSTRYIDTPAPDFSRPLAPSGPRPEPWGCVWKVFAHEGRQCFSEDVRNDVITNTELSSGEVNSNDKPVVERAWGEYPLGHCEENRKVSAYGHYSTWKARSAHDGDIDRFCKAIFLTYEPVRKLHEQGQK